MREGRKAKVHIHQPGMTRAVVAWGACAGVTAAACASSAFRWRSVWREQSVRVRAGAEVPAVIRAKSQPPPIGAVIWDAGIVLAHIAILELVLDHEDACIWEIGSGTGLTAVALALNRPVGRIVAGEACGASYENLKTNVERNGVGHVVQPRLWDMAREDLPCAVGGAKVTHVIGADVVYDGASAEQLVDCLRTFLSKSPQAEVSVLLVDRFSGGAVASLSGLAGMHPGAERLDANIASFEACAPSRGLSVDQQPISREVRKRVESSLSWPGWIAWRTLNKWAGLRLYRIRPAARPTRG